MTAKVLVCLYLTDDGRLTAAELVRRLRVSPASISKAVRDLEGVGLLRREPDPRGRRDSYIVGEDVWLQAWLGSVQVNEALVRIARHGAEVLGVATPAGARLAHAARIHAHIGHDMTHAAERWHETAFTPRKAAYEDDKATPPVTCDKCDYVYVD
nr:MarR family transcriptional regulator [Rhizohabitans arisaemae]